MSFKRGEPVIPYASFTDQQIQELGATVSRVEGSDDLTVTTPHRRIVFTYHLERSQWTELVTNFGPSSSDVVPPADTTPVLKYADVRNLPDWTFSNLPLDYNDQFRAGSQVDGLVFFADGDLQTPDGHVYRQFEAIRNHKFCDYVANRPKGYRRLLVLSPVRANGEILFFSFESSWRRWLKRPRRFLNGVDLRFRRIERCIGVAFDYVEQSFQFLIAVALVLGLVTIGISSLVTLVAAATGFIPY